MRFARDIISFAFDGFGVRQTCQIEYEMKAIREIIQLVRPRIQKILVALVFFFFFGTIDDAVIF